MRKVIISIILVFLVSTFTFGADFGKGPFGLKMGMDKQEFLDMVGSLERPDDGVATYGDYSVIDSFKLPVDKLPIKPNQDIISNMVIVRFFKNKLIQVATPFGLFTDPTGSDVKELFDKIITVYEKRGFKITKYIIRNENGVWSGYNEFWWALSNKEAMHAAVMEKNFEKYTVTAFLRIECVNPMIGGMLIFDYRIDPYTDQMLKMVEEKESNAF